MNYESFHSHEGKPAHWTYPTRLHRDVGPHAPRVLRLRRPEVPAERRPRVRLLALHQLSQQEKLKMMLKVVS